MKDKTHSIRTYPNLANTPNRTEISVGDASRHLMVALVSKDMSASSRRRSDLMLSTTYSTPASVSDRLHINMVSMLLRSMSVGEVRCVSAGKLYVETSYLVRMLLCVVRLFIPSDRQR